MPHIPAESEHEAIAALEHLGSGIIGRNGSGHVNVVSLKELGDPRMATRRNQNMKRIAVANKNLPGVKEISSSLPRDVQPSTPEPEYGKDFPDQGSDAPCQPIYVPEADHPINPGETLKFVARSEFLCVLRQRVDDYFLTTGRPQRDCPQMYVKTVIIFNWFVTSYAMLIFVASTWWQALLLAISLGLAMACVGFNIQHDGAHAAYSNRKWINNLMAMALDLLGGSSYVWKQTHNLIHHSFTNITGHDGDIDLGVLGRLSPHQRRLKFHRLQHVYLWVLYGFVTIKWQLHDDIRGIVEGQIGKYRFARPRGGQLVVFGGGKLLFISLALVIPMLLHPWYVVLLFFFVASFVQGLLLSVVFQLAHCVEDASFPLPEGGTSRIENAWAVHQVETTVDFARKNRLVAWFTGSLNYQIEHHLFPQICHVNYPAISKLVEETCSEFGIKYVVHKTFFAGIASHFRWLRKMGMPDAA